MSERSRSIGKPPASEIGPGLLGGCAAAAALLLLVQGWPYITPFLHNFEIPPTDRGRLPYTILYSACLCAGLSCISFSNSRRLSMIRKVVALVVAAYAFSALAGAAAFAWIDFAARNGDGVFPEPIQHFFAAHPINDPSDIGLWVIWVALTPGALIAGIALAAASHQCEFTSVRSFEVPAILASRHNGGLRRFLVRKRKRREPVPRGFRFDRCRRYGMARASGRGARLPRCLGHAGTAWRERATSHPIIVARGSEHREHFVVGRADVSSRLVLLYLGISQTSAYANHMAELVDARKAFGADILYAFFSKGSTLTTTTTSTDGKLLTSSSAVSGVPWADVNIVQYPGDQQYVVEITRKPSQEKWSVRQYHQPFDKGIATQLIADQYGIPYQSADDATKIYPRIETQLRAADVSLRGAGISLDLTRFAFVMPIVVFATLVLFGHWLKELTRVYHKGAELQWVLVEASDGIVGMVARIWLVAIVVGPWLLGVVLVEAMALTMRTRGMLNTPALEGVFSIYLGVVLIMLTVSTKIRGSDTHRVTQARAQRNPELGDKGVAGAMADIAAACEKKAYVSVFTRRYALKTEYAAKFCKKVESLR